MLVNTNLFNCCFLKTYAIGKTDFNNFKTNYKTERKIFFCKKLTYW